MTAARVQSHRSRVYLLLVASLSLATPAAATTQLLLARDTPVAGMQYKGIVELTIDPGLENARVNVTVDGQRLAEGLRAPYRLTVDFGPSAVEHKISVSAFADKKRVQWHHVLNRGHQPLRVRLKAIDLNNHLFEAHATSPQNDPIVAIDLWDEGEKIATATEAPYRFTVPPDVVATGFVQVTARTKSGEEAADFWSSFGEVHVENVEVRTVPIFVSVVDRDGMTRDDVDRSLFRILDNDTEGQILEFGKAFDQPISIALLLDASASMQFSMRDAAKAASAFAERTLKQGDRCSVFAIRDVPKRELGLTADREAIKTTLDKLQPQGRTALYDAISSAIRELRNENTRRAIVVLTDGSDTSSNSSYAEVEKLTQQAGIPIYFIAYETSEISKETNQLRYLASQTGGFLVVASNQNLMAKYGEIERDLRSQFAIRYQITDFTKRNQWRRIRVVLSSPKLTARTIRGYYAP